MYQKKKNRTQIFFVRSSETMIPLYFFGLNLFGHCIYKNDCLYCRMCPSTSKHACPAVFGSPRMLWKIRIQYTIVNSWTSKNSKWLNGKFFLEQTFTVTKMDFNRLQICLNKRRRKSVGSLGLFILLDVFFT